MGHQCQPRKRQRVHPRLHLTFKTAADRDAYLVHPDHKAFGSLVGPVLADVFVIDFWAQ
jgi:hypothetical protein